MISPCTYIPSQNNNIDEFPLLQLPREIIELVLNNTTFVDEANLRQVSPIFSEIYETTRFLKRKQYDNLYIGLNRMRYFISDGTAAEVNISTASSKLFDRVIFKKILLDFTYTAEVFALLIRILRNGTTRAEDLTLYIGNNNESDFDTLIELLTPKTVSLITAKPLSVKIPSSVITFSVVGSNITIDISNATKLQKVYYRGDTILTRDNLIVRDAEHLKDAKGTYIQLIKY